ncbi:hypothetical protein BH23GEM9_BH23GEM9_17150 [soil metagenome]
MTRYFSLLILGLTVTTACESPVNSQGERYTLVSVNAVPLPAPHPEVPTVLVTSGELILHSRGVIEETIRIQCRDDLPDNVNCAIQEPQFLTRRGTYSRQGEWIRFSGRESEARFENGSILVDYAEPPSSGVLTTRLLHRYVR